MSTWEVVYDGPSRPMVATADNMLLSISRLESGSVRWNWYPEEDEHCRLLAAAPDLLAACEEAVGRIWHDGGCRTSDASGPCDRGGWDIQEQIDAAIAKAKGETP